MMFKFIGFYMSKNVYKKFWRHFDVQNSFSEKNCDYFVKLLELFKMAEADFEKKL